MYLYNKYHFMTNRLTKKFNFQVFTYLLRFLSLKVHWKRSIWKGIYGEKKIN
jgi:hypothetical protein